MRRTFALVMIGASALSAHQGTTSPVVAEAANVRFVSDPLINLHHVLYAAAWARRPDHARSLSDALPGRLDAPMDAADQRLWNAALDYYDAHLVSHDLLRDDDMVRLQNALIQGDLADAAVGPELRAVLESTLPVYRRYFWPAHDASNRQWIADTAPRVKTIAPDVVPKLEALYGAGWFPTPLRADVVWVANREGAYTTVRPPHITIETAETGWTAVEIVFHEASHVLALPLQQRLARALGDRLRANPALPHAIQFYLTGAAVQAALEARSIEYTPASVAMFARVWPEYKDIVEKNWAPYVRGRRTLDEAIAATATALAEHDRAPAARAARQ